MGKSSINGPFSMAMLNNQSVWHHFISHESQLDHLGSHPLQVGLVYAAAVPVDAYLNRSANASPLGFTGIYMDS